MSRERSRSVDLVGAEGTNAASQTLAILRGQGVMMKRKLARREQGKKNDGEQFQATHFNA